MLQEADITQPTAYVQTLHSVQSPWDNSFSLLDLQGLSMVYMHFNGKGKETSSYGKVVIINKSNRNECLCASFATIAHDKKVMLRKSYVSTSREDH